MSRTIKARPVTIRMPVPTRVRGIAATNDVHSSVLGSGDLIARLRKLRRKGYLIADAGDFFQGSVEYDLFHGEPELRVLSEFYDVVVPGNHGFAHYLDLAQRADLPAVVLCNVESWPGPSSWVTPSGGLRFVGILGEQAFDAIPAHERAGLTVRNPVDAVLAEASIADRFGQRLIVLSHQGFAADEALAARLQSGDQRPPVAIFSSHCHSPSTSALCGGTHILKARENGKQLVGFELPPNSDGDLEPFWSNASNLGGLPAECLRPFHAEFLNVLGAQDVRNVADLVAQVGHSRQQLVAWLGRQMSSKTGLAAYLNIGAVRDGLPDKEAEVLGYDDLCRIVPFNNAVVELELSADADTVAEYLALTLGESGVLTGSPSAQRVATTDYIASRLEQHGFVSTSHNAPFALRDLLWRTT